MTARRVLAMGAAVGCVSVMAVAPGMAVAADGPPVITNTETVNVKLDATGQVDVARVYDQIAVTGVGDATWLNPVSTDSLRNLDGFGGFTLEGSDVSGSASVDGQYRQRAVSTFTKELPVTVAVTYTLDGQLISPSDLVGKTGTVAFKYHIENVTGEPQEITVTDGNGQQQTTSETIYAPYAGTLSLTVPSTFTDVAANGGGVVAGDGKGGSQLNFSLTLIPPLGDPVADVGFTAKVTDAVVPPANLTVIPVVVSTNPTLSGAGDSFKSGADTGAQLTSGAAEIDANLLKLSAGAGDLLAGLIKLSDGADELSTGLNDTAIPGANELADGSAQVADGLDELQGKVPDLTTGASDLDSGAQQIADGLDQLAAGLDQLADPQTGLPAASAGAEQLSAGAKKLSTGFAQLVPGLQQASDGADQIAGGLPTAKGGVDQVKAGLDAALAAGGGLDQLEAGVNGLKAMCGPAPQCVPTADAVLDGLDDLRGQTQAASGGLGNVSAGLASAVAGSSALADALADQLLPGAQQLQAGVDQQLVPGLDQLVAGLTKATSGVLELQGGANQLAAGADQLADGTAELNGKVPALADGIDQLADGANQVAAGNAELASGLEEAGVGSTKIANGLGQASDAVPQIEDGAQQLSTEGTQKLIAAGNDTALTYGTQYATLTASAERTADGGLPYGAPTNATLKSAAYSYDLAGDSGESTNNLVRAVIALLVGGAAVGAAIAVRRMA